MSLGTPWMLLLLPLVALAGWLMARARRLQREAACRLKGVAPETQPAGLGRRDWLALAALACVGSGTRPAAMEPASLRRRTPGTRSGHRPGRIAEHVGGRRVSQPAGSGPHRHPRSAPGLGRAADRADHVCRVGVGAGPA